jgi:hypothetical protein
MKRRKTGRPSAPHLADCYIDAHTPGIDSLYNTSLMLNINLEK